MRVLRDHRCVPAAVPSGHPTITTPHSLEDVGKLWADWGIHGLILVSFGIQVFLFLAAGMRRRSISRILRSLLWLAYVSADLVAIFILGHLSVHASEPRHQLLLLWAPLALLHLGGQYTMTAFSMQDNELWRRHLLGFVNQVVVAGYVVSRSSWPDRRLLAAMVLMFLSGCWRYAECTLCLYRASPAKLKESAFCSLSKYVEMSRDPSGPLETMWSATLEEMLKLADGTQPSFHKLEADRISSRVYALVSKTPLSDITELDTPSGNILSHLQAFQRSEHRCRAYNYVGTQLVHVYQHLYTKAPRLFHSIPHHWFKSWERILCHRMWNNCCYYLVFPLLLLSHFLAISLLVLFPFLSTSTTLVLLVGAEKSQLYSQADVLVSYILIIGAITLEAASLFIAYAPYCIRIAIWSVTNRIPPTKQWSELLGQYNMIKTLTTRKDNASGIMSFVPQWISNYLDDKTITNIPIYEDLKMFVLDKLLEFGANEQDWGFARFRGQLALGKWLPPRSGTETALHKSINDADFPTSVLIWHIALDIVLCLQDNTTTSNSGRRWQQMKKKKKMSRELSNYIMYLVFKCGVMLTSNTEILHNKALKIMAANLHLGEKDAMRKVFDDYKKDHHIMGSCQLVDGSSSEPEDEISSELTDELRPLKAIVAACQVAQELIDIHGEVKRWNLIAAVWLEMLYYIAPRCGSAFHTKHLTTGGELITHVLVLMQCLGPFLKPSGL